MQRMFSNILFLLYLVFIGCAIPISVGINHGYKTNKINWAHSVYYLTTRQAQLVCIDDENCIPIGESYGAGTSFVLEYIGHNTIMMTAAHLCREYEVPVDEMFKDMPNIETKFEVGIFLEGYVLVIQDILYVDEQTDICVFSVPELLGVPSEFAKRSPRYGDTVWSIGAPAGYFPPSAKPITQGMFSGEAERALGEDYYIAFSNFNMPTIPGMSGSPIFNKNGDVVGLVSAVNVQWHMISYSPTLAQLKKAEEEAIAKFKLSLLEKP